MRSPTRRTNKTMKLLAICIIILMCGNSLIGQDYASMFILYGDDTQKDLPVKNWHEVGSGAAQFYPGPMSYWHLDDKNTLIAKPGGGGNYLLSYELGYLGSAGDWQIGILLNDSLLNACSSVHISGNKSQKVNVDLETLVFIQTGDCIKLVVKPHSGSANFTALHAQVRLNELGIDPTEHESSGEFTTNMPSSSQSDDWAYVPSLNDN